MGRKRNPILNPETPVGVFAQRLRARIDQVPDLTFRKMATMVPWSRTTLSAACSGKTLPTWECTEAILADCCQADETEIKNWRRYYLLVQRAGDERGLTDAAEDGWGLRLSDSPMAPDGGDWRPRPDMVSTFDELARELRRFKAAAGDPSLRTLVKDMQQQFFRGSFSQTALSDIFGGKRRPNAEVYRALLRVLTLRSNAIHSVGEQGRPWKAEHEWMEAWARAEFARGRPEPPKLSLDAWVQAHRTHPDGGGSALDALAGTRPEAAAEVLFGMGSREVSGFITNLDKAAANAVLAEVLELHRKRAVELSAPPARKRLRPAKMNAGRTRADSTTVF